MTNFLNVAIPIEFKEQLGLVLICIATLNISVNLVIVIQGTIINSVEAFRYKRAVKKADEAFKLKMS